MTATTAAGGPLSAVLRAFDEGVHSLDEVAGRCDLSPEVVRACVDHLVRTGHLEAGELAVGCPPGGCGSCASGTADGAARCGAPGPSTRRAGSVLVTLTVRRRGA